MIFEIFSNKFAAADSVSARPSAGSRPPSPSWASPTSIAAPQRCGFPEVIFCEGKTWAWVEGVVHKLVEAGRIAGDARQCRTGGVARPAFPQAQQDRTARTFWLPVEPARAGGRQRRRHHRRHQRFARGPRSRRHGAGARLRRDAPGRRRRRRHSSPVAPSRGVSRRRCHRRRRRHGRHLPSVVGGLVDCPVIAVPTSIGYGAAFGGLARFLPC